MIQLHDVQGQIDEQFGLITRQQLLAAGLSRKRIETILGEGWLQRVHGGVYRLAGSAESQRQRIMAACLINGRGAQVTHRSACHLWGVELEVDPIVDVSTTRTGSARTPGVVVHRPRRIDTRHLVELGPFAVTTPARSVADLGAVVPKPVVADAMEQVLRMRWASAAYLRHLCHELENPQRIGPPVLLQVLDERLVGTAPSDSDVELEMAEVCRDFDVPMPVFQFEVVVDRSKKWIDFAFPDLKIAIEIDGWEEHMRFQKFQGDRVRRNELELLGWRVFNFTWHQVVNDKAYVARTLRRVLEIYGEPVGAKSPL